MKPVRQERTTGCHFATPPSYPRSGVLARATKGEQEPSPATSKAQEQLAPAEPAFEVEVLGQGISRALGWSRVVGTCLGVTIHGKTTPILFAFLPALCRVVRIGVLGPRALDGCTRQWRRGGVGSPPVRIWGLEGMGGLPLIPESSAVKGIWIPARLDLICTVRS